MIEKLNMQAIISANSNENEYVKDSLLTYDKVNKIKPIKDNKFYLYDVQSKLDACFSSWTDRGRTLERENIFTTV